MQKAVWLYSMLPSLLFSFVYFFLVSARAGQYLNISIYRDIIFSIT